MRCKAIYLPNAAFEGRHTTTLQYRTARHDSRGRSGSAFGKSAATRRRNGHDRGRCRGGSGSETGPHRQGPARRCGPHALSPNRNRLGAARQTRGRQTALFVGPHPQIRWGVWDDGSDGSSSRFLGCVCTSPDDLTCRRSGGAVATARSAPALGAGLGLFFPAQKYLIKLSDTCNEAN